MNNNLFEMLQKNIVNGCNLRIATNKFSLRAFHKLLPLLSKCNSIKILLTDFNDYKEINNEISRQYEIDVQEREMLTNKFEFKLKNDLMDFTFAKEVKEFIETNIEIKYVKNFENKFILIDSNNYVISNAFEITLSTLGFVSSDSLFLINEVEDKNLHDKYLIFFEQTWNSIELSKDAKAKLIDKLKSIYIDKTPYDLYQYTNAHLISSSVTNSGFKDDLNKKKFEETQIYKSLYEFQRHAVESIIDKIEKYNGCIVADSVGLGKTYEALAVIKYYELQGKRVLVLSPKKLINNWLIFNSNIISNPLVNDSFNYDVLAHTDLSRKKGLSGHIDLTQINWDNYDLLVIDESHNFRNGKYNSNTEDWDTVRYKKLMEDIILKGRKTSVLLLTATPVNNRMQDINNQINIITANNDKAFENENIKSIKNVCSWAEKKSNEWTELPDNERTIEKFQSMVGTEFRKLIDLITIARSRKQIVENYLNIDLKFPNRNKPISKKPNVDTQNKVGDMKSLLDQLNNISFSFYKPINYIKPEFQSEYDEEYDWRAKNVNSKLKEMDRENNVISLMRINLLKRFESSIHSFKLTLTMILEKTKKLYSYLSSLSESISLDIANVDIDEEDENEIDDIIQLNKIDIKSPNHLDVIKYTNDLEDDIKKLESIYNEYDPINYDRDEKLKVLIEQIEEKINNPINNDNKKVIVFTSYVTTAEYLYLHVSNHFIKKGIYCSLITGQESKTNHPLLKEAKLNTNDMLTYFSPKSKKLDLNRNFLKGVNINILIATDCVSEGQNLQDCDFLINYDIHWNPVRLIQRFGRIDRIGSTNNVIQMVNFWPNIKIEEYIRLESRVKTKMIKVSQTSTLDENIFNELKYEEKVKLKQLKSFENETPEMEDLSENVSFSNMTFSDYSVDFKMYYSDPKNVEKITKQPIGIFAIAKNNLSNKYDDGIIFLFKSESSKNSNNQFDPYYLIYINKDGKVKLSYQSTAQILGLYKSLTKDQKELNTYLINEFNDETNYGKDMSKYAKLLNDAILSLNQTNDSNTFDDLFEMNKTISNNKIEYVLTSFLIIRSE